MQRTSLKMLSHARHRGFFLLIAIALLAQIARADLQFDVFLGYDDVVREGSWFPVMCEIKNDGPAFTGVIEVTADFGGKGQSQQMPVELPTGTLKRVVVPVFASGRYSSMWTVRLLDERGKVRGEQAAKRARRLVGWELPIIGSLPRTAAGAPQLRPTAAKDQMGAKPEAVRFQKQIFPDNPLVLEGLNALYLSSEAVADLRDTQVQAILSWLNAGGHLIVAVDQVSDVTASPWLRGVLPCEPKDSQTVATHPEIHEWLRGPGWQSGSFSKFKKLAGRSTVSSTSADQPFAELPADSKFELAELQVITCKLKDGQTIVAAGDTPLIVTAPRGLGRVTALMFSPEREPFKSWVQLPTFWSRLTEVPGILYASADYQDSYGQSTDGIFGCMIDSRQVHKLPIAWLLLLLLVYLVIIGPLDQWWLKRIGKPMLTWITFPCYVALFSVLIYFIGYKLRAGEAEYNELHVVDALVNGDKAELRGRSYSSIYSPSNEKYLMESQQKFATFRGEFLGQSGGQTIEKASVWHSGDSFKADVFVPVWTSQLFVTDWWQSGQMPFTVTVTASGNGWEVIVQNNTDKPVKAAQLVVNKQIYPLGEIAAGGRIAKSLNANDGSNLHSFVQTHAQGFGAAVDARQRAFGESSRGQLSDLPNATMATSFLSQVADAQNYGQNFITPSGLDLSRALERGNAELLAWMPDYSPIKPLNQFKPKRSFRHTLWRVPVAVNN